MNFKLNGDELAALQGLPYLQQLVYFRAIRPYMDFNTGIVGIKRGISYQSIAEELYIEPHPGYKSGSPSRDQLRRAVKSLERSGVFKIISEQKRLIVQCVLATYDQCVQKKAAIKPPHESARKAPSSSLDNSSQTQFVHSEAATPKMPKAATHPVTGIKKNKTHIPDDYCPSEFIRKKAERLGCDLVNCEQNRSQFIAHHMSKGTSSFDWDAEYLCWLLHGRTFQHKERQHATTQTTRQNNPTARRQTHQSALERVMQANRDILNPTTGRTIEHE